MLPLLLLSGSGGGGSGEFADGGVDGDNSGDPISAIHAGRFFKIRT